MPVLTRMQLCEIQHNRIYVRCSLMLSGGVVVRVFPAEGRVWLLGCST